MRVLVLNPLVPVRGRSGGHTRTFELLHRLAQLGHEIDVCCPVPADLREDAAANGRLGIRVFGTVRPASREREVLRALAGAPGLHRMGGTSLEAVQLELLWQGMRRAVAGRLRAEPDVALVCWDHAAAWRRHLPPDLPAVLDLHDASWTYLAGRAAQTTGLTALMLRANAAGARRLAETWLPGYDALTCTSPLDAERIVAVSPALAPVVVPNGVDLQTFRPLPDPDGPPTVLFSGTMSYPPNAEGADWLTTRVWPSVRELLPDARLVIAGRDPGAALLGLDGADGISVTGAVASMVPSFERSHVVAVPIHAGGGTRLKVLEAGATARPIVSTTLGAEGLDLRDGHELVIADRPEAFAASLVGLLRDAPRRVQLGAAARAAVATYDWAAIGDRFEAVLCAAAAQPRGRERRTSHQ